MKYLREFSRVIGGLLFIFSGITKGIDPMGSMYKFTDYFSAAGIQVSDTTSLILGMILCTAEFIIGFSMLAGMRIRLSSWGMLIFMGLFTPLTFVLALYNPVSDCGCFGDAIHLSNWQTFFKNLVILGFVVVVFISRKKYRELHPAPVEWTGIGAGVLLFTGFLLFNYYYLPVVDFRPYSIGTNLPEAMTFPEGASYDEYSTTLIYEKDGRKEEFTLENYPSDDSTWVFVDQKSVLVKKGYEPPIHNFSLSTMQGDDLTDLVIYSSGFTLLMVARDLDDAGKKQLEEGFATGEMLIEGDVAFYVLTASSSIMAEAYASNVEFLFADETTLKTMIRSNPGYLVIRDGTITKKWSAVTLPSQDKILDAIESSYPAKGRNNGMRLLLLFSVAVLLSLSTGFLPGIKSKKS